MRAVFGAVGTRVNGVGQWGQTPLKLAVLQRREAVLRRGTHHDEALEDNARQHRALSPRGKPVRSPAPSSFFVLFHGCARRCVDVSYAGNRG